METTIWGQSQIKIGELLFIITQYKMKTVRNLVVLTIACLLTACNVATTDKTTEESNDSKSLYSYDVEQRVKELGIQLVPPEKSVANYLPYVRTGNLIVFSGKVPTDEEGNLIKGKLGSDLNTEQGYAAARSCAVAQLSAIKAAIGDLNKVVRIVKVNGIVSSTPDFTELPEVVNGFSDLMVEVFGEERGKHARAAVGVASLPLGIACDIDMVIEVQD